HNTLLKFDSSTYSELHRSGWPYVKYLLEPFHYENGVKVIEFMDNTNFSNIFEKWVGFWHNPPNMHNFDTGHWTTKSPLKLIQNRQFHQNLPQCLGIYVFSNYMAQWVKGALNALNYNIPVSTLYHPTEVIPLKFTMTNFQQNKKKTIIQIGQWLRNNKAIWELKLGSQWTKIWINNSKKSLEHFKLSLDIIQKKKFHNLMTKSSFEDR